MMIPRDAFWMVKVTRLYRKKKRVKESELGVSERRGGGEGKREGKEGRLSSRNPLELEPKQSRHRRHLDDPESEEEAKGRRERRERSREGEEKSMAQERRVSSLERERET